MRPDQIALQLFTVRDLLAADLPAGLRAVRSAGYRSVELAGTAAIAPDALARALEQADLQAIASHEPIEGLRTDPRAIVDRLRLAGCDQIVVPSMPNGDRATPEDVRRFAHDLAGLARTLAAEGVRLGYHNHDYEFAPMGPTTAWDVLLDELPEEVELELDVYWVAVAGLDPVAVMRSIEGRLRLLHVKDRAAGPDLRDVPPGQGTLPIEDIVRAAREIGVEWYIAELVDAPDPLAAAAAAFRYLERLAS